MVTGAAIIVLTLAVVIAALSIWGLLQPGKLIRFVGDVAGRPGGIQVAVLVRLVFGVALLLAAPGSRYPLVLNLLGWLALAAAVGLAIMGRARLRRFIGWFERLSNLAIRCWLLFAIAFTAFLIHSLI